MTVLLIEHHMDVITGICDRMLALNYGAMIGSGKPADVVADPRVIDGLYRRRACRRADDTRAWNFEADTTLVRVLARNAEVFPDRVAMREKAKGIWQETTWGQLLDSVLSVAAGLEDTRLPVRRHDAGARRQPATALRRHARGGSARRLRDAGISGRDARRDPPLRGRGRRAFRACRGSGAGRQSARSAGAGREDRAYRLRRRPRASPLSPARPDRVGGTRGKGCRAAGEGPLIARRADRAGAAGRAGRLRSFVRQHRQAEGSRAVAPQFPCRRR